MQIIAGVDEAGRGPLAGPVVAAAVILNPYVPIKGLADSKTLTSKKREDLYAVIVQNSLAWSVARVEAADIDAMNILQATLLAMRQAVFRLAVIPQHVQVDGNICPDIPYPVTAHIKGDQLVPAISAASIIAKVTRDRIMCDYDDQYPGYGLAEHKGYPTPKHLFNLRRLGVTPIHRRSFAPVRYLIEETEYTLTEP